MVGPSVNVCASFVVNKTPANALLTLSCSSETRLSLDVLVTSV